jgi:hypothetical protein
VDLHQDGSLLLDIAGGCCTFLFYSFENPPTGRVSGNRLPGRGFRLVVVIALYLCPPSANFQSALGMQAFIIVSLLGSRDVRWGPVLTLLIHRQRMAIHCILVGYLLMCCRMVMAPCEALGFLAETIDMFNSDNPSNVVQQRMEHSFTVHCSIRELGCRRQALYRWSLFGRQTFSKFVPTA